MLRASQLYYSADSLVELGIALGISKDGDRCFGQFEGRFTNPALITSVTVFGLTADGRPCPVRCFVREVKEPDGAMSGDLSRHVYFGPPEFADISDIAFSNNGHCEYGILSYGEFPDLSFTLGSGANPALLIELLYDGFPPRLVGN